MSRTRTTVVLGIVAGLALGGVVRAATHNEPLKGVLYKAFVMTAYGACTSPNTMTAAPGLVLPACLAVRQDTTCGYGAKGSGKVTIKGVPGDVQVKATLAGLNDGCEGETLTLTVTVNSTNDDCGMAPDGCTIAGALTTNLGIASCVVTQGKCIIKSTANTFAPGTMEGGKHDGWEIQAVRFRRGTVYPFAAGIFVP